MSIAAAILSEDILRDKFELLTSHAKATKYRKFYSLSTG